jgi:hypothetical protein
VLHVHTTASDGGGSPDEVIEAARRSGLGFVAITDHNNLEAKAKEGWHSGVLVLVGTEVSTTAGHVLGLGLADPTYRFSGDALDALADVTDLGGFSYAAHPLNPREDLRWTGWDLPGAWGLELLNGDSEWRRAGARVLWSAGLYALNHRYALLNGLSSAEPALERWDVLLSRRDVAGIVGADAHSRLPLTRRRSVRFPSYESVFGLGRNHVLLSRPLSGEAAPDARAVLEALRSGRSYVGLDALAPAGGFAFVAEADGKRWTMGESVEPRPGLVFRAGGRVPAGTRVVLKRDGRTLAEGVERLEAPCPGPGVYRVEARVSGVAVPWVLTNPIYVFDAAAQAARRKAAAWPPEPPPPPAAVALDDFEQPSAFHAEADAASSVGEPFLAPGEGLGGSSAGRLRFRLGVPGPGVSTVSCAVIDRTPRAWPGRSGLVFSVRGDGAYRMWVQVRDENPASADEGTEWWFASVRTSPEWRRVALPFARLRTLNPKSDGRLDPDRVRALVFVVDAGAVKPGTAGTIWLDDVGVY